MIGYTLRQRIAPLILLTLIFTACQPTNNVTRVTLVPDQSDSGAPIFTATPTLTATATATASATPTTTPTPTNTPTATATPTFTATPTASFTPTTTPTATPELRTPTPVDDSAMPDAVRVAPAGFSEVQGWSCGDFPCGEDIEGWLQRIQVPRGFSLSHEVQFPGQVQQMAFGRDGRLYATVLEDGTLTGAVYVSDGQTPPKRYSETIVSPIGLAFQPGTDVLYVTGRLIVEAGGLLHRVEEDGQVFTVIDDLPCCYLDIGSQPNGMVFGPDGLLYVGVGGITDRGESLNPDQQQYAEILPNEAAVLQINPHTGDVTPFAQGIRNPFDVTVDSNGQLYATDTGLITGEGDRVLAVDQGEHFGWPYYRLRGCADCPPTRGTLEIQPDLFTFPNFSLPRGLVAYRGNQFPQNMRDTLFVTLWNGTPFAQRVVWIDPDDPTLLSEEYEPLPFVTGLLRPIDVVISPDGALLVADFIYGHVWRVEYTGENSASAGFQLPTNNAALEATTAPIGFATSTPAN